MSKQASKQATKYYYFFFSNSNDKLKNMHDQYQDIIHFFQYILIVSTVQM